MAIDPADLGYLRRTFSFWTGRANDPEPTCSLKGCGLPVAIDHDILILNVGHDDPPSGWWHQACWRRRWTVR